MPGRPDLTGAEIADVALEGATLVLWLENVRGLGLVTAGPLRLDGVRDASSRADRYADDAYPLQGGMTVRRARWSTGRLALSCLKETGPGDADEAQFEIGFASMSHDLRGSLGRSLRALLGTYPGWGDRGRRLPGAGQVTIAALRAAR